MRFSWQVRLSLSLLPSWCFNPKLKNTRCPWPDLTNAASHNTEQTLTKVRKVVDQMDTVDRDEGKYSKILLPLFALPSPPFLQLCIPLSVKPETRFFFKLLILIFKKSFYVLLSPPSQPLAPRAVSIYLLYQSLTQSTVLCDDVCLSIGSKRKKRRLLFEINTLSVHKLCYQKKAAYEKLSIKTPTVSWVSLFYFCSMCSVQIKCVSRFISIR